ncbi:MAG TPA: hypothetical protein VF432_28915 [Thermoanaerobaculia bacterium]
MSRFAHAVREELWSRGRLLESRLSHGEAHEDDDGIVATDARNDDYVAAAELELARLREVMPDGFTVRLVAESGTEGTTGTITVRDGALSIVTSPAHIEEDVALLRSAGFQPAATPASSRPVFLWQNGSASVLLHELLGHPFEHGITPPPLPAWLHVDIPLAMRRATFRDVPLLRMQHVRASQAGAPFDPPGDAVEITLLDGGAYDPLTDIVTLRIAASSAGAFTIREPRDRFVFTGARGEPLRYPGVICSREGQELVVGSIAPVMLTELR